MNYRRAPNHNTPTKADGHSENIFGSNGTYLIRRGFGKLQSDDEYVLVGNPK